MGVIVLGYVAKPEGQAALTSAIEEARRRGAHLVVVNSRRDDDAASSLDEVRSQLAASGVEHEIIELEGRFDPAEDLLKLAEERPADLIVIGLRRRTPIGKLIMGSNAQRVLLEAPCPVLAVKAPA